MLTVQPSAGLYYAVQYDGTNGSAIAATLQATDYANRAGVVSFKARIMRAGGLLTGGHQFTVMLGNWVIWADEGSPYVIAPPLPTEAFEQQYQTVASAGDISALQAQVDVLDGQVIVLGDAIDTINDDLVTIGNALTGISAQVATNTSDIDALIINLTNVEGQLGAKSNVGHTHAGPDVNSGTLPYQRLGGTIAENATVNFNRATLVTPGTAADTWTFSYNGVRVSYANEYACWRVRGIPDFQVPCRIMSNASRDGSSTLATFQVSLSDAASHLFQVMGNGDILGPGGASMLPTAPVAVTMNAVAGTANAVTISDGVNSGTPYPVTTTLYAADNRVFLDGSVANPTGVLINAQTTLFTVTSAHRPAFWTQRAGRTSSGLAARITIKPDGTVVLDQALAAAATISFDGVNWRKS